MRRFAILACSIIAVLGITGPAHAATLPVTYNFLLGAVTQGVTLSPNAPGTNDWTCRPTAAHPDPVVLVHGTTGAKDTNWATYGPLLKNNGYCVYALTYGGAGENAPIGGLGRMQDSAAQLAAFVARVRTSTGAAKVDLIGHSQGTLMPNYYAKFLGGASSIDQYISLASLWRGTNRAVPFDQLARFFKIPDGAAPLCKACPQMATGSAFVAAMREGGVAVPGIRYTNIVTKFDQLVGPYTSGLEAGMTNIVLQDVCASDLSEHFEIAASPTATQIVLNTLDAAHAKPVVCRKVLPYVGPLV